MATFEDDRLAREAEFHDRWATEIDTAETLVDESFTAVTAMENNYIRNAFGDVRGKRLLDYGCGASEAGVYFAKQGASVVGVDVSDGMLEAAKKLAGHHGVTIETRQVTSAHIPADENEFDLIYGNGVLHHVALDDAIPELARVMKPQGTGCFIEPLSYNPAIEVYRHLARTVRTPDEHPLSFASVKQFRSHFRGVEHNEFWLLSLSVFAKFFLWDRVHPSKERYWKKIYTDAPRMEGWFKHLRAADEILLRRLPPLRYLCWNTVIQVRDPK
jgi:ubiquinone/menaquinone biosynthesis C-methylase UbiE